MPKPTAKELAKHKRDGPIRLSCSKCFRDDFDGVKLFPGGWLGIEEVQSLEASLTTYEDGETEPPGYSVFDWETHSGLCPECQLTEGIPAGALFQ